MPNAKEESAPSRAENFEFSSPQKAQKARGAVWLPPVKEYFEFSSPEEAQKANDAPAWREWREPSRQSQSKFCCELCDVNFYGYKKQHIEHLNGKKHKMNLFALWLRCANYSYFVRTKAW